MVEEDALYTTHLLTKEQNNNHMKYARELLETYKNCQNKRIDELLRFIVLNPNKWLITKCGSLKIYNQLIIVKRLQSMKKVLYAIFFNSKGPVV